MVADSTINEIKTRLNIIDIVSEYVPLKRAGQTFLGLCPFHKEKTPSFNVHPSRQIFHCFGCHKGGDVFTFVSAIEGLAFPETLEKLASRAGVTLERTKVKRPLPQGPAGSAQAMEALTWAAKYFHFLLTKRPEGKAILAYLEERGLTQKSIERFNLGLAPAGWSGLRDQLVKRGFSPLTLQEAGLLTVKEDGKNFDRFRDRLMFPITDKEGHVIGFGARRLNDDENQPKYLNSSDSPIFSKRRNLYGLFENARGIRLKGEALIVEGYMDVIGLWEKGIDNAIAVMGTALTDEHCRLIRTLTNRVVTVFDPDRAGEEAWRHSIHLLMEHGILARDVSLPKGQDPDDFAKDKGADAFYELCAKAPRQITKWLKEIAGRGTLGEHEKSDILNSLAPIIRATRRLNDRVTIWDNICLVLGVSTNALKALAESQPAAPTSQEKPRAPSAPAVRPPPVLKKDPVEMALLKNAIICHTEFLAVDEFEWKPILREATVRGLLELVHKTPTAQLAAALQTELGRLTPEDEITPLLSGFLVQEPKATADDRETLQALLNSVRNRARQAEIKKLSTQAQLAQRMGNEAESLEILGKIRELRAQISPET
ncbi:MAG: DNA primase [Deltaproteobacteria bacterium]|nr:DNA primase [Deltaproteobacteria bacterium]